MALALVLSTYRGAIAVTGDPYALASALATLHDQPTRPDADLRRVASFNAFCIVPTDTLYPLVATHPPVEDRIRNIRHLVEEMA